MQLERDTGKALAAALGLLVLGVGLGLVLRLDQLFSWGLPAGNATHAHSHTLYWGWAGLALFALFFERVGLSGPGPRLVLGALALQGLATLFVFYRFGYQQPGVVLSAVTLAPFLGAVGLFLHAARGRREGDLPFLRAAVVFVVLAYVSALTRVVLKVQGVSDPLWSALAVHLFLGAFGAFFVLGLMGLTVHALGVDRTPVLSVVLGVGAPLIALPSMLSVPGIDGTPLGGVAKLAAVVMLVPASAWLAWVWGATDPVSPSSSRRGRPQEGSGFSVRQSSTGSDRPGLVWLWRSAALAWASSVLAFALVATGALGELARNRHAVILVVHLQTLGVVTMPLLLLIERRLARPAFAGLWLHQLGLGLMLAGLLAAALWLNRWGLALAALGGAAVLAAQVWAALRFWRSGPSSSSRLASPSP